MDSLHTVNGRGIGAADAWSREAWRVGLLATEFDIALDEDALIVSDVYDLRALGARLRQRLTAPRRRNLVPRLWRTRRRVGL